MTVQHKVLSLIFVQGVLIVSSFLAMSYIEVQNSTNGKMIDATGKNRLLTNVVQLETYRALFHESETHRHVEIAIGKLEQNTALLKHGGIIGGVSVPALPQELHSELDEMTDAVDQYTAVVLEIINSKDALTYDNVEAAYVLSNRVVEITDGITHQLGAIVDDDAVHNSTLLIFLGIGNVVVLALITALVWRIVREYVDTVVHAKRFEALGRFSAVMAHNIRNPLGSLSNSVELIKEHKLDPSFDREMARMVRSVKRISHQIEGILNFVNGTPLNMRSVVLLDTLRNAVDMLLLPKNIDLRIPDDDQDITVDCDDKKIEFVLYNLLLNAVQSIGVDPGHIIVRIRDADIERGDKAGTVILEFENSGPSIPPDDLSQIFEPLFTTKKEGVGLGLAYCKSIIELHGGLITASNQDGLVLFSIQIPKTQDTASTGRGGGYVES